MLGIVIACYKELDKRVLQLSSSSNEETLRTYFENIIGPVSKQEIMDATFHEQRTVERMLQKLQAEGMIEKAGAARATAYRKAGS